MSERVTPQLVCAGQGKRMFWDKKPVQCFAEAMKELNPWTCKYSIGLLGEKMSKLLQ